MRPILMILCLSITFIHCKKEEEKLENRATQSSIQEIKASSFLTEGKIKYLPQYIADNTTKPWCVPNTDKEPSLEITFNKIIKTNSLHFLNGYAKGSLFKKNSRISKLTVIVDNGIPIDIELPDTVEYAQSFTQELVGKKFKLIIKERYEGEKYQDLCLTELSFDEYDFDDHLYFEAFCSEIFQDFKKIEFINGEHYITLTNNNKLTAFLSPAQMDIKNEGKGNWKFVNEDPTKLLEGKYKITLVQNGNDDLTSDEARITTTHFDGDFSIPLVTDKSCKKLNGSRKIFVFNEGDPNYSGFPYNDEMYIIK
ncbi:NADase-type glycan-binding domain-containing protein [Leptospira levettii]|uniref:NAD glycohydrolase translocation F5/8 type C domain-containing protein n=1 Tax=Leptospira levettii TaxID=2023178 RepID=A0ABY2MHK9_9LEPT|nr:hypothetical protein [Leptospira levettii]TGL66967.1 hypothetical protein EHQ60_16170 [Leptospira levettii]TGM82992.1 hypothetical protein EHR00_07675 [Leptospira levettii]